MQAWIIQRALAMLENSGVIAYPTEAVFGFGCYPWDYQAVMKILNIKRRPIHKGLILIASHYQQLAAYVDFDRIDVQTILASNTQATTWLLPSQPSTPNWLTGCHQKIAIRVSHHPIVKELCEHTGALISTSANCQGCPPLKKAIQVQRQFGRVLDLIIHSEVGGCSSPTQIIDAQSGKIIRDG